jgi:hypothetical protein
MPADHLALVCKEIPAQSEQEAVRCSFVVTPAVGCSLFVTPVDFYSSTPLLMGVDDPLALLTAASGAKHDRRDKMMDAT